MAQAAYDGWKTDMLAGKTTLMAAAESADVTELAAQARADRVAVGQVEADGVELRDGNLAGAGDWIVTRLNERRLGVFGGRDWVKNGDAWYVERRYADGSLAVRHLSHGGRVRLPLAYVRDQVQLLYATTAHRAQGTTVDTAHPLITPGMARESLYVLATRGRERTTFYVATHDLPFDDDARVDRVRYDPRQYAAREVLINILATEGTALSATDTITEGLVDARSLATLVPRYLHAAHLEAEGRYRDAAVAVFGENGGRDLAADPAWGAVVRRLYDAESDGWEPSRLLDAVAGMRELGTAESVAEVLSWRIDGYLADAPTPPRHGQVGETGTAARERLTGVAVTLLGRQIADRAQAETAWPALVTALRRAEQEGHDAAPLLSSIADARELRTARNVSEVLAWRIGRRLAAQAADGLADATTSGEVSRLLPWVAGPPVFATDAPPLARYLREASDLIASRVSELADTAVRHRPAWMNLLGHAPDDPAQAQEWLRDVAVIAAYREQFNVADEDPRQVLGPCPEPGHAGYVAHRHAAESVLSARRLSGLEPGGNQPRELEHARAHLATDIYLALPDDERAAVAAAMAAKLGVLWFADPEGPDEQAATWPAYAAQLAAALTERGHLTAPVLDSARVPSGDDLRPLEAELAERRRGRTTRASDRSSPATGTRRRPEVPVRPAPTEGRTPRHRQG
jgi:hypothetical protein